MHGYMQIANYKLLSKCVHTFPLLFFVEIVGLTLLIFIARIASYATTLFARTTPLSLRGTVIITTLE